MNCGTLQKQKVFVNSDSSSSIPFSLIVDKGYRITEATWQQGKQMVLQPIFARNDRVDFLTSPTIASDRGG